MELNSVASYPHVKLQQPTAPTPPPGGNIENRKPPAEPLPPAQASGTTASQGIDRQALAELKTLLAENGSVQQDVSQQLAARLGQAGLVLTGTLVDETA